jgi:hypothetical protein
MALTLFILAFALVQTDVPYKPNEEFKLTLDYQFKQRTMASTSTTSNTSGTINLNETESEHNKRTRSTGPLPYLIVNLKLLKLGADEVRIRIINGNDDVVLNKKVELDKDYKIVLGFTDDVKDWVTPHEYNIYLLSSEKKETTRIHLFVQKSGEFFVNNEMRGKF